MEIRGVSYGDVERIIAQVSRDTYGGNVTSDNSAHPLLSGGRGFRGRLRVTDSRGEGARTTASGRHGPYACWHAYRDVLAAIFAEYPDAKVRTAMARYDGREGFEENYPATAYLNIGSQMSPAYMPQLCEHGRDARYIDHRTPVRVPVVAMVRESVPASTTGYGDPSPRGSQLATELVIGSIDALLAEVAADGWTNPYDDPDSPARRLSGA